MDKSDKDSLSIDAFLRLLTANNKSIYAYIYSLVPNHFDADDILQETVAFMYQHFSEFKPDSNFVQWAFKIAYYRVLSFYSKRNHTPLKFDSELLGLLANDAAESVTDMNLRLEALARCRTGLVEHDKLLLEMIYEKGLPVKKISERSDKSIYSIYRSLSRIHDILLRCIRRTLIREDIL